MGLKCLECRKWHIFNDDFKKFPGTPIPPPAEHGPKVVLVDSNQIAHSSIKLFTEKTLPRFHALLDALRIKQ